jgi:hypothetical protein
MVLHYFNKYAMLLGNTGFISNDIKLRGDVLVMKRRKEITSPNLAKIGGI